jgi:hypothetical protein
MAIIGRSRDQHMSLVFTGLGKGKVVPVLFLNWAPRHERVLGEWRYSSTHSLTSAIDGGVWSASRPGRFTPRKIAPGTHWIGGWVGPRAILYSMVKRKISSLRRESKPRAPIVQPVAQRCTDWAIPAHAGFRIRFRSLLLINNKKFYHFNDSQSHENGNHTKSRNGIKYTSHDTQMKNN